MLSIRSVEVLDDYWLRLALSNGATVERNVRALRWGPVFEGLRTDHSQFMLARARGGTVEWPGELDLAPETLIWGSGPLGAKGSLPARLVLTHPTAPGA